MKEVVIAKRKREPEGDRAVRVQYGALPYRIAADGSLEVLLVTSRTTRRWILPKGWPIKGLKPAKSAAREAYEEAGVLGRVENKAIGSYRYEKMRSDEDGPIICEVSIFPLAVTETLARWPEAKERDLRWVSLAEAETLISEDGLRALLALFARTQEAR